MPGTPTTNYAIPTLAGTTLARDIDTEVNAGLVAIDGKMVGYSQGPIGSRPTSTLGTPGIAGRRYRATDTGQEFTDTGTSWLEIAPAFRWNARLSRSTGFTVPSGADTAVEFTTEDFDVGSMIDIAGVGGDLIRAPQDAPSANSGLYLVTAYAVMANMTKIMIMDAAGTVQFEHDAPSGGVGRMTLTVPVSMGGGQAVKMAVRQDSGTSKTVTGSLTVALLTRS